MMAIDAYINILPVTTPVYSGGFLIGPRHAQKF